jgi:hypothetical protein
MFLEMCIFLSYSVLVSNMNMKSKSNALAIKSKSNALAIKSKSNALVMLSSPCQREPLYLLLLATPFSTLFSATILLKQCLRF